MKVSYNWLQEFVAVPVSADELAARLSMAGLEVSALQPAVPAFDSVVVGEVLQVDRHPDADKLTVCQVNAGGGENLQIVCGAPNVRAGMKAPVILPGGSLPDGTRIRKTRLRGVESAGMLCSGRELALGEDHSGLYALPDDAPVGTPFGEYLGAGDKIIDIEITPNRGDCLGMLGVAREVSALFDQDLRRPDATPIPAAGKDTLPVRVDAPQGSPVFAGRVIRGIDPAAETPLWMRERLRRAGIRPVNPVVDVTQYVMLELGQPMHAYDLTRINRGIVVRFATAGEKVRLLNGSEVTLTEDVLVIADQAGVLGLAGIMGGEASSVQEGATDIFLESAYFDPATISGRSRRLGFQSDAGYRFERGVDPAGQVRALERATRLLLAIAGGKPGPIQVTRADKQLPERRQLILRRARLDSLLGVQVPDADVQRLLERLEMHPRKTKEGWRAAVPSHRFDIEIEEDLIEEVGRLYGYEHIPPQQYPMAHPMAPLPEDRLDVSRIHEVLVQRGYHEAITYSFVDEATQRLLSGGEPGIALANPITAEMTHMRLSLWPGLLQALRYNLNRQQARVRLFETGLRFIPQGNEIKQENIVSGVVYGPLYSEQWGKDERPAAFADVKNEVEAMLTAAGRAGDLQAQAAAHPALHPGQSARLVVQGEELGWLGALHPEVLRQLDLPAGVLVFELRLEVLLSAKRPAFAPISQYPAVRRDLAVVVDETVEAGALLAAVRQAVPRMLQEVRIFDIYRGPGIDSGRKSIALALILQESSRTLTDEDADKIVAAAAQRLRDDFQATLRE